MSNLVITYRDTSNQRTYQPTPMADGSIYLMAVFYTPNVGWMADYSRSGVFTDLQEIQSMLAKGMLEKC